MTTRLAHEATGHSALYELAEHVLVNQYTHPHYLHSNLRMPLTKVVGLLEILEQSGILGPDTPGQDRQILFTYFQRTQALADIEAYEAQRQHDTERDGPDVD